MVVGAHRALVDVLAHEVCKTPWPSRRARYDTPERKLLSVEEMSMLVNSIMDPRDRATVVLLAKTGVRRGELLRMDVDDIDWEEHSITLKPTRKRSNRIVFFDDEAAFVLRRWLRVREKLNPESRALFISYSTLDKLTRSGLYTAFMKYAVRLGFHEVGAPGLEDRFSPHCLRHWFTTWLLRNGMKREYVKELRGDRRGEARAHPSTGFPISEALPTSTAKSVPRARLNQCSRIYIVME